MTPKTMFFRLLGHLGPALLLALLNAHIRGHGCLPHLPRGLNHMLPAVDHDVRVLLRQLGYHIACFVQTNLLFVDFGQSLRGLVATHLEAVVFEDRRFDVLATHADDRPLLRLELTVHQLAVGWHIVRILI